MFLDFDEYSAVEFITVANFKILKQSSYFKYDSNFSIVISYNRQQHKINSRDRLTKFYLLLTTTTEEKINFGVGMFEILKIIFEFLVKICLEFHLI